MRRLLRRFLSSETGSGLTEYALIIAAVALGLLAALAGFRAKVGDVTNRTAVTISQQSGRGYGFGGRVGGPLPGATPAPEQPPEAPAEPDSTSADTTAVAAASKGRRR